jgi:molybdopterin-guanine dinucleotide biosynthesis protein A
METYPTRINAVITCGGNSLRMGESKALLHYHGMPQYKWVLQLCKQLGIDAAVSCKKAHQEWFDKETILIFDDENLGFNGPMLGLMSSINKLPNRPILLLGCDYPLLRIEDIEQLIQTHETFEQSVAFYSKDSLKYEPLLAIYHPKDFKYLQEAYQTQQFSLQEFLNKIAAIKIKPAQIQICKSFDTPEDFLSFPE